VVVDKTGVVQWISVGRFSDDEIQKRVERVIKE
jgi:predicted transcriptional regulator